MVHFVSKTFMMALDKMKTGSVLLLIFTCLHIPLHRAQRPSATTFDLSVKNMDFAMNLYRKISDYHDKNIFFSPLSISTSFAALSMASDGVTRDELLKGLNLEELELADQPHAIPRLFQLLQENITRNGSLTLDESMALFVHRHFQVAKAFENQIKTYFDADVKTLDFTDTKASARSINEYIEKKTENRVTEVLSEVDPDTQLMLINTIFFKGAWQLPFNSNHTQSSPFHIDNYNIQQVQMMYREGEYYTMEDVPLGAKVLKLPYTGGVSMLILLPNRGIDYTVIDDEITAARFLGWVNKLYKTKLDIYVPKFKMEQSYPLHRVLPSMGMRSIFGAAANLTRLSENEGLKVSEVLHKAVIDVDESGTTAAAATTISITPYSLPPSFIVNRPFFFFIYHEDTNALLFMGRVIDPNQS